MFANIVESAAMISITRRYCTKKIGWADTRNALIMPAAVPAKKRKTRR